MVVEEASGCNCDNCGEECVVKINFPFTKKVIRLCKTCVIALEYLLQ